MRPARLAAWIPFAVCALGAHVLACALLFGGSAPPHPTAQPEDWHFLMRRCASDAWHDGVTDSFFVPHVELQLFTRTVGCYFWNETVNGVKVRKSRCRESFSDKFEDRWRFEQEIAAEHLTHPWAGSYFRGFEFASGAMLALSPSGGAWGRSCSASQGVGPGTVGHVQESADGLLHVSLGNEPARRQTFCSVRWGERLYLVEPELVEEFLLLVRLGIEPRTSNYGRFYLREGDENWDVEGEPRIGLIQR